MMPSRSRTAPPETPDTALATTPLRLGDAVEVLTGANGHPMLYHGQLRKYIRLSPMGLKVVERLDGSLTGYEISALFAQTDSGPSPKVRAAVMSFLSDLQEASVLNVPGPRSQRPRLQGIDFMLRLPLPRPAKQGFDRVAQGVANVPRWLLYGLAGTICIPGAYLAVSNWVTLIQPNFGQVYWLLLTALLFVHMWLHETAHAVICRSYGVSVREVGIGLLFYFFPIAYVDHTDSYRVESRAARASIALAGPVMDLILAGITAAVGSIVPGAATSTFVMLSLFQLGIFLTNLNPLFPSDGYHAFEAAVGALDLRRRAFSYITTLVTGRSLPTSLRALPVAQRRWLLVFACAVLIYTLFFAAAFALAISRYLRFWTGG